MEDPVIHVDKLDFSFGSRPILKEISLHVPAASIYGFLGPNGAGKTTTIKCLLGLLFPRRGRIDIFGQAMGRERLSILDQTGAMVEAPSLYDHLTATQNLEISRRLRPTPKARIPEVLETAGLTDDAHRPVRQFSTGMKQRLCLAIALLSRPRLLMLDEPINGLDPGGIIEIRTLLSRLNRDEGITIFLSSHILSEIEKLCSHVGIINKGAMVFEGKMENLLQLRSGKERVILETGDNNKAMKLLDSTYRILSADGHLLVPVNSREDIPQIVDSLTREGISIYQVRWETSDLESSFLGLINL